MTSFPATIRPARVHRALIAGLLVLAGFASGLGVAQFMPHATGLTVNPAPAIQLVPSNAGRSPDERQAVRGATKPVNGAGSPDARDE
jgi:hypothetical protein